jgi:hypothetical protein
MQGKVEHARETLSDVYRCVTQGFDTADLEKAK